MKVYGDAYIGDKDRTTYMEYTQDKGVDIKGMFHIEQGSTGWRNMEVCRMRYRRRQILPKRPRMR